MMALQITPGTKIGELLDAYPELEDALVSWVPAFSKLKNPILRKTVAKVATVEQAAALGSIPVRDLVQRLRTTVGQPELGCPGASALTVLSNESAAPRPDWIENGRIVARIDADAMLAKGEHPVGETRKAVAALQAGEIVLLTASFRPVPLIDMFTRSGMHVWAAECTPGCHEVYFYKNTV